MRLWQLQYHTGLHGSRSTHARFITDPDANTKPRPNGNSDAHAYSDSVANADTLADTWSRSITYAGTISHLVAHDQLLAGATGARASATARV